MIQSFGDRTTEELFHGEESSRVRKLDIALRQATVRKLDMLNAAAQLDDLRVPPGNRLELLHGDLAGFYSIRVNQQWRLIFQWTSAGPTEIRLVDYHR